MQSVLLFYKKGLKYYTNIPDYNFYDLIIFPFKIFPALYVDKDTHQRKEIVTNKGKGIVCFV